MHWLMLGRLGRGLECSIVESQHTHVCGRDGGQWWFSVSENPVVLARLVTVLVGDGMGVAGLMLPACMCVPCACVYCVARQCCTGCVHGVLQLRASAVLGASAALLSITLCGCFSRVRAGPCVPQSRAGAAVLQGLPRCAGVYHCVWVCGKLCACVQGGSS